MKKPDTTRRLFRAVLQQWKTLVVAIACVSVEAAIESAIPLGIKPLLDEALTRQNMSVLNIIAVAVVGIYFVKGFFTYGRIYFSGLLGQKVIQKFRNQLYTHINKLSLGFFDKSSTGLLMSRVTNDIYVVQYFTSNGFIALAKIIFMIIYCVAILFYTSWKLSLVSLTALPVVAFFITLMGRKMRKVGHHIQQKLSDLTDLLQETISGIRVVKSFTMEDKEIGRFRKENAANVRASLKGFRIMGITRPTIEIMGTVGLMGVIYIGGRLVGSGELTAGGLVAFLFILGLLFSEAKRISELVLMFNSTLAASDRLYEIMDLETEYDDDASLAEMPPIKGRVDFQGVSLSYNEGEEVLTDINLEVEPGKIVALVGPSGAGKTSMVNLLPRFYQPSKGRILIDGVDIAGVRLRSLRSQIGIVPQDTLLFSCSIRDNIAYGRPGATEDEIRAAARAANAEEFIDSLPNGYETLCGERGVSLSGGQRQRVAIARAILRNPRILILDEATSALDTASERLVQDALERLMRDRTTFVIAHRLSTILKADRILVMAGGAVVESGSHQQLYKAKGLYKQLYDLQYQSQSADELPGAAPEPDQADSGGAPHE